MTAGPGSIVLTLLMLAAFALVFGGVTLLRRGQRSKSVLMLVCAAVMVGNVLIWTV